MVADIMGTETKAKVLTRGFLFACTRDTEEECFERMIFATERGYGPIIIRARKGDILFLNNSRH